MLPSLIFQALRPKPPEYPKELLTFGDHIRARRLDMKLLQKDVGQIIGVSAGIICYWERNHKDPSLWQIPKIIEFLGRYLYAPAPTLGAKLLAWRTTRGISRTDMGNRLGVDPGTLRQWESGEKVPYGRLLATVDTLLNS